MKFTKMHGIGNDYVYVDLFKETVQDPERAAKIVSHRHFGVGSDGLILIAPSECADARMIMYNADGSLSEMCGNGLRCVAKYVYDHGIAVKETMQIETGAGVKTVECTVKDGKVEKIRVNMGTPVLNGPDIPSVFEINPVVEQMLTANDQVFEATCLSMGNPHCVIYVDDIRRFPVHIYGPVLEHSEYFPNRVNVEFVQVRSDSEVVQRTWERGAGETWACGTGACAVCVAGVLTGRTKGRLLDHLTGGDLELEWDGSGDVFMTGPAEEVFTGEIEV